jgi:ribosomal-protein-serine acetyltransferase
MLPIASRALLRTSPIRCPRVHLLPIEMAHVPAMWSAIKEARSTLEPWLPWVPFVTDQESSTRFAEASEQDWDHQRAFRFAIQDNRDLRFLGTVGLEGVRAMHFHADLGYWLVPTAVGYGVMTEACRHLIHWAFEHAKLHRIRVAAATDNLRSLAVIRRLGFHPEGVARQAELCANRWLNHEVFGLLKTDPRAH